MADRNQNTCIRQTPMTSVGEQIEQEEDTAEHAQINDKQLQARESDLASALATGLQLEPKPLVQIANAAVSTSLSQHTGPSSNVNVSGSHNPSFLGPVTGTFNFHFGSDSKGSEHPSPRRVQHTPPPPRHALKEEGRQGCYREDRKSDESARVITYADMQHAADCCEAVLKRHYKTTGSYVQLIPWVDDDNEHIMDIYTELLLEEERYMEELVSYEGMFCLRTREDDPIKRIVLVGLAGRGKSTLVDKMAYDWAVFNRALRQFKLVFVLKLGAMDPRLGLVDVIFDQLLDQDTSIDRSGLEWYIQSHPKDVLVLMDGFDELILPNPLREIPPKSVLTLLSRKSCRECWVVVTTRPSHMDRLVTKQLMQKPFARVRVTGFTEENIAEYVNRFYGREDPGNAQGLLRRIMSSCVMTDLAKSPMLLLLMCLMWRQNFSLPETLSCLFKEAVLYLFKRKSDVSLDCVLNVMTEIGKVALRGLLSPNKVLSFEERQFGRETLNLALNAGLLTRQSVLAKGLVTCTNVQFIHKTFQEYCAAKYLQSLPESEFQDALNPSAMFNVGEYEHLLRFCCGNNETCTRNILGMFVSGMWMDRDQTDTSDGKGSCYEKQVKLALECCFESQSQASSPDEFTRRLLTDEIALQGWIAEDLNSFSFFMKCVASQAAEEGNPYLSKVKKIHFERCNFEMSSEGLACSLKAMTSLLSLSLLRCSFTRFDLEGIMSRLSHASNLTELDLSGSSLEDDYAESWSGFPSLKNLQSMRLTNCRLSSQAGKHVIEFLSRCPNLIRLDLSLNNSLGASGELCFPYLMHCQPLQVLDLSCTGLGGKSMTCLVESMGYMPNLIDCNLSANLHLLGTAPQWSALFRRCRQLQKLSLIGSPVSGMDLAQLSSSLSKLPDLLQLDLSLVDRPQPEWKHLERLSGLSTLDITRCAMTSYDLQQVVEVLEDSVNLVEMHVSMGRSLSASAAIWAPHLKRLKHIRKLLFEDCELERYLTTSLVVAVASMRCIAQCTVDFQYDTATYVVEQTSDGTIWDLSNYSLSNTGLDDILVSLADRDDVVELTLAQNSLRGSAEMWSVHLRRMKRLQKLDLSSCSLSSVDMREIGKCLGSLPDVTEVDLSYNRQMTD